MIGNPALPGGVDDGADQAGGKRALVVVLEQDGVGIVEGRHRERGQPLELGALEQGLDFLVDAHDLLGARDHAGLGGRRPARHGEQSPVREPLLGQLGPDGIAVGVVAHHADQPHFGAQRRDVGRDVRRSPQGHPGLAHVHHGDRRLG